LGPTREEIAVKDGVFHGPERSGRRKEDGIIWTKREEKKLDATIPLVKTSRIGKTLSQKNRISKRTCSKAGGRVEGNVDNGGNRGNLAASGRESLLK